jgi:hypothetical protein
MRKIEVRIGDASVRQGKADMVFTHPYAPLPKCLHGLPTFLTEIPRKTVEMVCMVAIF